MTEEQAIEAAIGISYEGIYDLCTRCYEHPEEASHDDIRTMAAYILFVLNVD